MKLDFIPLDKLVVSKANMRFGKKAPDVSDILPTVRSRGILQPVIVRPNCAPDGYEIVAGSRRFHAAKIVAEERRAAGDATPEPMPCAILDEGDDAAAIEASMIENMARLATGPADAPGLQQGRSSTSGLLIHLGPSRVVDVADGGVRPVGHRQLRGGL